MNNSIKYPIYKDRRNSNSIKWDLSFKNYPYDDLLPLNIADMDFLTDDKIIAQLKDKMSYGIYGYEALPDDGELKFFCFGVHSIDFEKGERWDDLSAFAKTYGNRPSDYYYATIGEIYDYSEATKRIEITDTALNNPTAIDLYVKIDGEKCILKAGESLPLA